MAEFKPIKCTKAQMDAKAKSEGQLFFCTDTGHIYLDTSSSNRVILNANKATQDSAGQQINTTYIKNLSLNTSTNKLTYTKGNGATRNIDLPYTTKEYVDSAITNSNNSTSINREIEVLYMNNKLQTYSLITSNNIFPTLTSPQYIKKIDFKGIPLSTECTNWSNAFINTNNLFEINNLDTSAVRDLYQAFKNSQISFLPRLHLEKCASVENIFYNCSNLIAIGGMKLDTYIGTTNLDYSFYNCNKLLSLGLYRSGGFDSMNYTFYNCCSLNMESTLSQIYSWGNLINAAYAFYNTDIQNIVSAPKLSQAASMYSGCKNLKQVMISNASSLINASQMFYGCSNLSTVNIMSANYLKNASGMFSNCKNLTEVSMLYCNNFVDASEIFSACSNLHIVPKLNLYNATNVSGLFAYSNNIYSNQINNIYNTLLTINVQNIPNKQRNVSNANWYGPLRDSKISWSNFDSTQQSALTSAGWIH